MRVPRTFIYYNVITGFPFFVLLIVNSDLFTINLLDLVVDLFVLFFGLGSFVVFEPAFFGFFGESDWTSIICRVGLIAGMSINGGSLGLVSHNILLFQNIESLSLHNVS